VALTALWDQQIKAIELDKLLKKRRAEYKAMAVDAYAFAKKFLDKSKEPVRQDDVEPLLTAQLELDGFLKSHLDGKKKTQAYWPKRFAYYVIDSLWEEISK
jgi:hypothetical protein